MEEGSKSTLIIGAGRGGSALLKMLLEEKLSMVCGIVDVNPEAPGLALARQQDIPTYIDLKNAMDHCKATTVFNLTGDNTINDALVQKYGAGNVIGGMPALFIWRMVTRLQEATRKLLKLSMCDPLTDIFNRRHVNTKVIEELRSSARYKHPFSVVMIDLDRFKAVNDAHGHKAGDAVLKEVANRLQQVIRKVDVLGRWGGEEFIVLLPHQDSEGAGKAATNWLEKIRSMPIDIDGTSLTVTFSAGVATCMFSAVAKSTTDFKAIADEIINAADIALYKSKINGRNNVTVCEDPQIIG